MKKKRYWIITGLVLLVFVVCMYVSYMTGKYWYLLPGTLGAGVTDREQWLLEKAKNYALECDIKEERLIHPRLVNTVRVYFGGQAGMGGVEVTLIKLNGEPLGASW